VTVEETVFRHAGEFRRPEAAFREPVLGEPERYHLYVSGACPWCHRTMIMRELAGLTGRLGISYVAPYRDEKGWQFTGGEYNDPVNGFEYLSEAYMRTDPAYDGRISAPVLWDKEAGVIAANESEDLVVLFDKWGGSGLYPEDKRPEIDHINDRIYTNFNNGVYRAGFAGSQRAYERAFEHIFETLDWAEEILSERKFLTGDDLTIADIRFFPTLVRFDTVYYVHFRANGKLIRQYENLWPYARSIYQLPRVAETVTWDEIKIHYYTTHDELNPKKIVPLGPIGEDWAEPSGR
jgi:putative glutathione S-transferase